MSKCNTEYEELSEQEMENNKKIEYIKKNIDKYHLYVIEETWAYMVDIYYPHKWEIGFYAYPISFYENFAGEIGFNYISKETGNDYHGKHDVNKYVCHMSGLFTYSGCWTNRVYFPMDTEYWDFEFFNLHELYEKHIMSYIKGYAIANNMNVEDL